MSTKLIEQHLTDLQRRAASLEAEGRSWLDEFAGQPPYGMRHRKLRHHLAGIEQVRKLWGDQAAAAARYKLFEKERVRR